MNAQQLADKAEVLRTQGQGKQAASQYIRAANLFAKDTSQLGMTQECWHMAGVSYKMENNLEQAMPCFDQALSIANQRDDQVGVGRIYRDIGIMYDYQKRYSEGLVYLQKSVDILQTTTALAELGISEAKIGQNYLLQGKSEQAEQWLKRGLQTLEPTDHWFYIMTTLLPLAGLEYHLHNYQPMLNYLLRAEQLIDESGEKDRHERRRIQICGLMAHAYLGLGDRTKASQAFEQAKELLSHIETKPARDVLYEDINYNELVKQFEE